MSTESVDGYPARWCSGGARTSGARPARREQDQHRAAPSPRPPLRGRGPRGRSRPGPAITHATSPAPMSQNQYVSTAPLLTVKSICRVRATDQKVRGSNPFGRARWTAVDLRKRRAAADLHVSIVDLGCSWGARPFRNRSCRACRRGDAARRPVQIPGARGSQICGVTGRPGRVLQPRKPWPLAGPPTGG